MSDNHYFFIFLVRSSPSESSCNPQQEKEPPRITRITRKKTLLECGDASPLSFAGALRSRGTPRRSDTGAPEGGSACPNVVAQSRQDALRRVFACLRGHREPQF